MKSIDSKNLTPYPIYSDAVSELQEIEHLQFPSDNFILFLAADFTKSKNDNVVQTAKKLINKGLCYVSIFGPSCEKGHELFDFANILWEQENRAELHVKSTWHDHETLEEALWLCIFKSMTDEVSRIKCSTVILSVGNSEWKKTIDECFKNFPLFNNKMENS